MTKVMVYTLEVEVEEGRYNYIDISSTPISVEIPVEEEIDKKVIDILKEKLENENITGYIGWAV